MLPKNHVSWLLDFEIQQQLAPFCQMTFEQKPQCFNNFERKTNWKDAVASDKKIS